MLGFKKEQAKGTKIAAVTIAVENFVHGELVTPGTVLKVPERLSEKEAKVLIGTGRALVGETDEKKRRMLTKQYEDRQINSIARREAMQIPPYLRGAMDAKSALQGGGGPQVSLEEAIATAVAKATAPLQQQIADLKGQVAGKGGK